MKNQKFLEISFELSESLDRYEPIFVFFHELFMILNYYAKLILRCIEVKIVNFKL